MSNTKWDVIDDIDALVDEQMANYGNRTGYDYNVGQAQCHHCRGEFHGLAITRRMEELRRAYRDAQASACGCSACELLWPADPERQRAASAALDAYRYDQDDSEILCPGSRFIGPWISKGQLLAFRELARTERAQDNNVRLTGQLRIRPYGWGLPDNVLDASAWENVGIIDPTSSLTELTSPSFDFGGHFPVTPTRDSVTDGLLAMLRSLDSESVREAIGNLDPNLGNWAARRIRLNTEVTADETVIDETVTTPQQRALPRPATTPPFWADDPTRARRPKRRRSQPNRQGIA